MVVGKRLNKGWILCQMQFYNEQEKLLKNDI